ncbi:glycosyltransferase [Aestuariimicrobium ganziense]|uniref:glycosyltransferase n=1 Tax=Aestuariimicrobium ganziense TaxID=2773677 RepID=UPI0019453F33|nr:glycosyltransferase [Aestuariimicrobium ganziense]
MRAGVYFPWLNGRGGAERLAIDLALGMAGRGMDAHLLVAEGTDVPQIEKDFGRPLSAVTIVELPAAPPSPLREVDRTREAIAHHRRARRLDLDVFINAEYGSDVPASGRWNVFYCHFPHPLTTQAQGWRRPYMGASGMVRRLATHPTRASAVASYDQVWANSAFTRDHVRTTWERDALVLHPACSPVALSTKTRTVLTVGRFQAGASGTPYKGQDHLIRAFATMTDLHVRGWSLILAGGLSCHQADAEYFSDLEALAEGLPVALRPNVSRDELEQLYGTSAVYWHAQGFGTSEATDPRAQEHFGISTVEAMSAGCIPLVYGVAGPKEVVDPMGAQFQWTTIDELLALTRTWVEGYSSEGPPRDEVAQAVALGRARARDFAPEAFTTRLNRLLDDLLESPR